MAVTNTGIVLRTITGVNESDLFLDSEATSVTTNTGIVERSVVGVHDANFVHPLGDEEVSNGGFDDASSWSSAGSTTIVGGLTHFESNTNAYSYIRQDISSLTTKTYKIQLEVKNYVSGAVQVAFSGASPIAQNLNISSDGVYTAYLTPNANGDDFEVSREFNGGNFNFDIDNVSVKEVLVNRESTATNTGIVERSLTGVNESDLWLDSESTSVVNNTGIVERPITGVNESDPMFPDNTISNIVNIAGLISSLIADLKARATTFENEEATQNILINLQNC